MFEKQCQSSGKWDGGGGEWWGDRAGSSEL